VIVEVVEVEVYERLLSERECNKVDKAFDAQLELNKTEYFFTKPGEYTHCWMPFLECPGHSPIIEKQLPMKTVEKCQFIKFSRHSG